MDSLSYKQFRPVPGGGTLQEYRQVMHKIMEALSKENIEAMLFLCKDYVPSGRDLTSPLEFFNYLEDRDLISHENVLFLAEALHLVRRMDLLKLIPCIQNKHHFEDEYLSLSYYFFSNYRVLTVHLLEELTRRDFEKFHYQCKDHLNLKSLDEATNILVLIRKLEEEDVISNDNFTELIKILKCVENVTPLKKFQRLLDGDETVAMPMSKQRKKTEDIQQFNKNVFADRRVPEARFAIQSSTQPLLSSSPNMGFPAVANNENQSPYTGSQKRVTYKYDFETGSTSSKCFQSDESTPKQLQQTQPYRPPPSSNFNHQYSSLPVFSAQDRFPQYSGVRGPEYVSMPSQRFPPPLYDPHVPIHHNSTYPQNMDRMSSHEYNRYMSYPMEYGNSYQSGPPPPNTVPPPNYYQAQQHQLAAQQMADQQHTSSKLDIDYTQQPTRYYDQAAMRHTHFYPYVPQQHMSGTEPIRSSEFSETAIKEMVHGVQKLFMGDSETNQSLVQNDNSSVAIGPRVRNAVITEENNNLVNDPKPAVDEIQEEVEAVTEEAGEQENLGEVLPDSYKMDASPVGLCIIVNNVHFEENFNDLEYRRRLAINNRNPNSCELPYLDLKDRIGSNVDAEKLVNLFTSFDFEVQQHNDLDQRAMKKLFVELGSKDHSAYDCFLAFILSHGDMGCVFGVDSYPVLIMNDIQARFYPNECLSLKNKPKIFFIQACQGTKNMPAVSPEADLDSDGATCLKASCSTPVKTDFLVAYATVPGHVSYRSREEGSYFIQVITSVFEKNYKRDDLLSMLIKVSDEISTYENVQVPMPIPTLRKKVFFTRREDNSQRSSAGSTGSSSNPSTNCTAVQVSLSATSSSCDPIIFSPECGDAGKFQNYPDVFKESAGGKG